MKAQEKGDEMSALKTTLDEQEPAPAGFASGGVLEATTIHPFSTEQSNHLDETTSSYISSHHTTATFNTSSSIHNTASLIQSAARSIMDDTSHDSTVSDDDREDSNRKHQDSVVSDIGNNGKPQFRSPVSRSKTSSKSPTLSSLQTKTLPVVPDEQDRKRFMGCLAALLASMYSYDTASEHDDLAAAQKAESMAYMSIDNDVINASSGTASSNNGKANTNSTDEKAAPVYSSLKSGNLKQQSQRQQPPKKKLQQPSVTANALNNNRKVAAGVHDDTHGMMRTWDRQDSNGQTYSDWEDEDADLFLSESQSFGDATGKSSDPKKHNGAARRNLDRLRESRERHRQRRYQVLSSVLINSAEMLQLETVQAKAFLPMLATLLTPHCKPAKGSGNQKPQQQQNQHDHSSRPPRWRNSFGGEEHSASRQHHHHRSPQSQLQYEGEAFLETKMEEIEHLRPFMESITPGNGFRCLSMFLLQHLMHSAEGYDARIRHAIKTLGVLLLVQDMVQSYDTKSGIIDEYDMEDVLRDSNRPSIVHHPATRSCRTSSDRNAKISGGASAASNPSSIVTLATRKFEALEHWIALKLLRLYKEQEAAAASALALKQQRRGRKPNTKDDDAVRTSRLGGLSRPRNDSSLGQMIFTRQQVMRGFKIGGTAVAAGALFAVTGGLAAPGIAAGVAALAGGTAVTAAAAAVLTSTAAVTAIFGVGGGGLAAYKMERRTKGLTEFVFQKESSVRSASSFRKSKNDESSSSWSSYQRREAHGEEVEAELFSTVCLSGWLRDELDFQRPWGVTPTSPPLVDRLELLERFYAVYRPDHIVKSASILESWKGEETQLWALLKAKYGQDPNALFPLEGGSRCNGDLTLEQAEVIDNMFIELGYISSNQSKEASRKEETPLERLQREAAANKAPAAATNRGSLSDSLHGPHGIVRAPSGELSSVTSTGFESVSTFTASSVLNDAPPEGTRTPVPLPKHISTVWDYKTTYGGELYTVRWESHLLTELCESVSDLAFDVVAGASTQLLKTTALSTLLSAVAWPYALVNAANMIDGTWTLGVERADEAGRELARSLVYSSAGNRPITLVGYSFGARAIYSCLKQLARFQDRWEEYSRNGRTKSWKDDEDENDEAYDKMREPASIVEDAVLMGLPNHLSLSSWRACRQVVAGRVVNCYSQKDLILSLMFQFKRLGLKPVCGTCPVLVDGVENIDVSDVVLGHQDYCLKVGEIFKRVKHGEPFRTQPPILGQDLRNTRCTPIKVAKMDI